MDSFVDMAHDILQKQYACTNISALIELKAAVWEKYFGGLSAKFNEDILDPDTCCSDALDYFWSRILKITRSFEYEDGRLFVLDDDQFREILKIRAFSTTWDGRISSMNLFLQEIFASRGIVYVVDRQNMERQIFVFAFELEEWEIYLFEHKDILPRPAGIENEVRVLPNEDYFGFAYSGFDPWGSMPFKSAKTST